MKVFWTDAALNQLKSIRDYLAQTSPEYAHKVAERLVKLSEQIGAFPHSGRMVPEHEIGEV
jgi:toxin ParE1/3/4